VFKSFFGQGKDSSDSVQGQALGLGAALLVHIKRNAGSRVTKQFLNGLYALTLPINAGSFGACTPHGG
jgi:hypothetical protein